jgi:hypothetical protein
LRSQLLRDLVHTTERHLSLKQRAAKQAHELEAWRDKARALPPRPRCAASPHALRKT